MVGGKGRGWSEGWRGRGALVKVEARGVEGRWLGQAEGGGKWGRGM